MPITGPVHCSGLDIQRYWDTLHAAGIDAQRLASFDRSITHEPSFSKQQAPQLVKDLQAYLVTLCAVHGTGSAVWSVARSGIHAGSLPCDVVLCCVVLCTEML